MTPEDKPTFFHAVARLAVATREAKVDEVMLRVYWEHLQVWPAELVLAAAERLALGAYFPKVGEWRTAVIVIQRERQAAQRDVLRRLREPLCAICRDTGWQQVDEGRVRRCGCAGDRHLEVLGQRALPSVPPAHAVPRIEHDQDPER